MSTRTNRRDAGLVVPEHVYEAELRLLLNKRERLAYHKKQVKALETEVEISEGGIIAKLKAGLPVIGKLIAKLGTKVGRKTVSWKDEWATLVSKLGFDVAVEEAKLKAAVKAPTEDIVEIVDPTATTPGA